MLLALSLPKLGQLRLNDTSPSTIEIKEDLEEVIKRIHNITHQRIERFK